jgi:hypothetical protein
MGRNFRMDYWSSGLLIYPGSYSVKPKEEECRLFWDVAPCRSCMNRRFAGKYCLHLQRRKIRERGTSVSRWLQTASLHVC